MQGRAGVTRVRSSGYEQKFTTHSPQPRMCTEIVYITSAPRYGEKGTWYILCDEVDPGPDFVAPVLIVLGRGGKVNRVRAAQTAEEGARDTHMET